MRTEKNKILLIDNDEISNKYQTAVNKIKMSFSVVTKTYDEAVKAATNDKPDSIFIVEYELCRIFNGTLADDEGLDQGDIPLILIPSHCKTEFIETAEKLIKSGYSIRSVIENMVTGDNRMSYWLFEFGRSAREKMKEIELVTVT